MPTKREHWAMGRQSGYSVCCIAFFFVRSWFMKTFVWRGFPELTRSSTPKSEYRHIVCPFCKLWYAIVGTEIFYSYCRDCDWRQFRRVRCLKCGEFPYNPMESPCYECSRDATGALRLLKTKEFRR